MLIIGLIILIAVVLLSWMFTAPILGERGLQSWSIFGSTIVFSIFSIIGFELIRLSKK